VSAGSGRLPWPPDLLTEPRPSRAGTAVYAVALALLALWDLGGRSLLHRDVPRFAVIATEMLRSGDWLVPTQHGETYANKPILYVWAVAVPSALFGGVTPFLVRLPSALALLATALCASAWGRARSGSVAVGRLAGLLVATTWFVFELGRSGRPDMLATAFATAGATWTDRAILGRCGRHDAVLAGLALGAGLLSKGPVTLLPALLLLLVPRRGLPLRERARRARPFVALACALAVAGLWVVPAWLRGGEDFLRRLVVDQTADRLAGRGNHVEAWWDYLVTFPRGALPWSPLFLGAALLVASRRGRALLGDASHVVATLLAFGVLSLVPTKDTRYAAILVPPLAVAAAQAVSALSDRARDAARWGRRLRVLGVAALVAAAVGAVVAARAPDSLPWVVPVLLALAAGGAGAARGAALDAPRAAIGRIAGLALLFVASGLLLYWSVLPRGDPIEAVRENRAVASVLPAGVPVVVLAGGPGRLVTDDLFEAAPEATYARDAAAIPSRAAAPSLVVVCLEGSADVAAAARGESPVRLLARPRRGDASRTLVVLRFGPAP
jgi:4-amino-4-deoxy-L-arabinose transferase-like glycosyltransferase